MNKEKILTDIFKKIFPDVSVFNDFTQDKEPSWDSINHMILISDIEETFNISFSLEDILNFNSFAYALKILNR